MSYVFIVIMEIPREREKQGRRKKLEVSIRLTKVGDARVIEYKFKNLKGLRLNKFLFIYPTNFIFNPSKTIQ